MLASPGGGGGGNNVMSAGLRTPREQVGTLYEGRDDGGVEFGDGRKGAEKVEGVEGWQGGRGRGGVWEVEGRLLGHQGWTVRDWVAAMLHVCVLKGEQKGFGGREGETWSDQQGLDCKGIGGQGYL